MAERDPSIPQVNDPNLETELIRVLSVVGPLGKLNLLDIVIPTVSLGSVVTQTVEVRQPSYRSTDIFSTGVQTAPAAATVLADTGALPAGTYDVIISAQATDAVSAANAFQVQHRNAANTANLALWNYLSLRPAEAHAFGLAPFGFSYEIAINERLRIINVLIVAAGNTANAVIFARRRT